LYSFNGGLFSELSHGSECLFRPGLVQDLVAGVRQLVTVHVEKSTCAIVIIIDILIRQKSTVLGYLRIVIVLIVCSIVGLFAQVSTPVVALAWVQVLR